MRSLKELYNVLYCHLKQIDINHVMFVCIEIEHIIKGFSSEERTLLLEDFRRNKPSIFLHKEFYDNEYYRQYSTLKENSCWWELSEEGNKQRIKFIKHLINNLP